LGLEWPSLATKREERGNHTHAQHSGCDSAFKRVRIGGAGGKGGGWAKKWQREATEFFSSRETSSDFVRREWYVKFTFFV